ncbi:MAG: choice-of-anchor tandem repeat NxxGxxAF-containing protein [Planctomycetota bacterium]
MNRPIHRHTAILAVAVLPALPAIASNLNGPDATASTTVIVDTTTPVPGGDGSFSMFNRALINSAGQVALQVRLSGTSGQSSSQVAIYRFDGVVDQVTQIGRLGADAPDGNGVISGFDASIRFNDAGQIAFEAGISETSGGFSDDRSILMSNMESAGLVQVAREGQATPDGNGTFFEPIFPALSNSGQTVFLAGLVGVAPSADFGLYVGDGTVDGIVELARGGLAASDGNGTLATLEGYAVNDAGHAVFRGLLSGTSGGSSDDAGYYLVDFTGSGLTQIAREGDSTPDGDGALSTMFGTFSINDAGQVAYAADLTGTSGGDSDDQAIFRDGMSGGAVQIARKGQAAPDGNGSFLRFLFPKLNNVGQVAFVADLAGTSGGEADAQGIYVGDGTEGGLTRVARTRDQAPTSNGSLQGRFLELRVPTLNNNGQVLFNANIDLLNGGSTNDAQGIFFYDELLGLTSVARTGDALDGSTIVFLGASINSFESNGRTSLNDLGQVVYHYGLADGRRGVAIATIDSAIAGDADFDGIVDLADFGLLRAGFGSTGDLTRLDGDFNKDGVVDLADFGLLRANFGAAVTSADLAMVDAWAATVPEPTRALAGFAALTLVALRRRTG